MDRLQNPFSVYDFLGYLIPGALAVYAGLIILSPNETNWVNVLECAGLNKPVMIFPLTIGSYIVGHMISYMSSVFLEKYSIWSVGYPSKYLLGINDLGYWKSISIGSPKKWEKFVRAVSRFTMAILLLPISSLDFLFGKLFFGRYLYTRKLDDFTHQVIINHLNESLYGLSKVEKPEEHGDIANQNFFNVIYHYCLEKSSNHQSKFQNYVALYGFLRALSFLFVALFWSVIITSSFPEVYLEVAVLGTVAYILYMAYNKFSRRFTLEVLMAFVTLEKSELLNYQPTSNITSFSEWSYNSADYEYVDE